MSEPITITICDDSRLAQRQLALAIQHWDAKVSFANDGKMAIDAIKSGRASLLFLDLNMPVMDGYQVLEAIRAEDLPTMVIVISGDIQQQAQEKTQALGAIGFIQKPLHIDELNRIVENFGLLEQLSQPHQDHHLLAEMNFNPTQEERFQEMANIAMGQAAQKLSILLDTFITLSIPKVNLIDTSDLYMIVKGNSENNFSSIISQGFIGGGISGEAILIVDKTSLPHIAQILGFSTEIDETLERDILVDLAGLLSSSFIKSYFKQIGILHINQGIPAFLDYKGQLDHLNEYTSKNQTLAIEVSYSIPSHDIHCDLLIVFTINSLQSMNQRAELNSWTL